MQLLWKSFLGSNLASGIFSLSSALLKSTEGNWGMRLGCECRQVATCKARLPSRPELEAELWTTTSDSWHLTDGQGKFLCGEGVCYAILVAALISTLTPMHLVGLPCNEHGGICFFSFFPSSHYFVQQEEKCGISFIKIQLCLPISSPAPVTGSLVRFIKGRAWVGVPLNGFLCRGPGVFLNISDPEASFTSCKKALRECVSRTNIACLDKELILASSASVQSVHSCVSICCLCLRHLFGLKWKL